LTWTSCGGGWVDKLETGIMLILTMQAMIYIGELSLVGRIFFAFAFVYFFVGFFKDLYKRILFDDSRG